MNQAVTLSEQKYGEFQYWGNSFAGYNCKYMEEWYNKYFRPYVKTLKTECVDGVLYVYLADGSKFKIFNYSASGTDPNTNVSAIHLYFYPYANRKTSILGKDCFTFYINYYTNKKWAAIEPYKYDWDGTREHLINGTYGCRLNKGFPHYCTALIQYSNWKIPEDYPYKF